MQGMDMGVATSLGSFASFIAVWVVMMAAMMLPGAAPAVLRRAQAGGGVRAAPLFIGSYLALAQKLLPARAAVDVPLALAIAALGVRIVLAPSSIPGLVPPM
jgi:predicted metal-binding membrane protein